MPTRPPITRTMAELRSLVRRRAIRQQVPDLPMESGGTCWCCRSSSRHGHTAAVFDQGECKPLSKVSQRQLEHLGLPRSWRVVTRCRPDPPDPPVPRGQLHQGRKCPRPFRRRVRQHGLCATALALLRFAEKTAGRGVPLQLKYAVPDKDPPPDMAAGKYYARSQLSGSTVRFVCKLLKVGSSRSVQRALSSVSDLRRARAGGGALHPQRAGGDPNLAHGCADGVRRHARARHRLQHHEPGRHRPRAGCDGGRRHRHDRERPQARRAPRTRRAARPCPDRSGA